MSRRKHLARREPNGRPQRTPLHREPQLPPPTEVRRLIDAALAGMRPAEWGTMLGRLCLAGQITETQFAAGRRWCNLVAEYSQACCSPRIPQSAKLEPGGGNAADPDSAKGAREARRHARIVESFESGAEALRRAGMVSVRVVGVVCEQDLAPVGQIEIEALRNGLQALAVFWSAKGRRSKPMPKPSMPKPSAKLETQ
ncbi:hypothetical protein [Bradyrhizobium sp. USDA 4508]